MTMLRWMSALLFGRCGLVLQQGLSIDAAVSFDMTRPSLLGWRAEHPWRQLSREYVPDAIVLFVGFCSLCACFDVVFVWLSVVVRCSEGLLPVFQCGPESGREGGEGLALGCVEERDGGVGHAAQFVGGKGSA